MKTQIIQLNQNDDTLSVRDKISWSQTERVVLVWPAQGCVLYRQLDLTLINRYAASMGAQLGLVTHDSEVRFYARWIGIPVFSNFQRAQDQPWKTSRPTKINFPRKFQQHNIENIRNNLPRPAPAWMEYPIIRFICIAISVFALMILGVFILPSAKIIILPQVETQSMRFDLSADPSSTSINLSTGLLPTYSKEAIVEGSDSMTSTGSMSIPDEPALGNLKFTNISKQTIIIPVGIIVSTQSSDPIRFITLSSADESVYPSKSVVMPARAIKPGTSGNLPPDKLLVIEGNLGMELTVTNPDTTGGGTDATFPTPTTHDIHIMHDRLLSQLKGAALIELQSMLPDGDTIISPTLSMIETLEDSAIPSIGEPGNQLKLTLRLRFQSQVVSGEVLRSVVTAGLNSNTSAGYSPIVNSLEITQLNQPSLGEDGIAHWTVSAVRKLQTVIQAYQAIDLAKGATVAKAKEKLSAYLPIMEQVQISLSPSWWPWLPLISTRIKVAQAEIP